MGLPLLKVSFFMESFDGRAPGDIGPLFSARMLERLDDARTKPSGRANMPAQSVGVKGAESIRDKLMR
jgi:hypothetical protein